MRGQEFEAAATKYADNIYAVAFNYFKNPYDADDIVQEVLMSLYQSEASFESDEHLKYWLLRVAINKCKKISLSARVRRSVSLEEYTAGSAGDAASLSPRGLYAVTTEQDAVIRRIEILRQIMSLPQKYREVIHLYYYEDYDTKQIAEVLKLNEGTVRTRLARGRKKLKEVLSDV